MAKTAISTSRVRAYQRQIAEQRDGQVPWDIALDILGDTVIAQGQEIAQLRTALEKVQKHAEQYPDRVLMTVRCPSSSVGSAK